MKIGMKLAKLVFYVVICLRWMDITQGGGWETVDELTEPEKVTSCGIFVKENEDFLWLATDQADDGTYNGVSVWPKGVILSQTAIHLPEDVLISTDAGQSSTSEEK